MKEEEQKTKKIKILIIILLIILLFAILSLITYKLGKIGYLASSTNPIKIIEVTQNNINWDKIEDLDIFSNPIFQNKKMIAPMSKGSYEFEIANKLDERIKYKIYLEETNELNVNMKYRLKLDNIYVIGNENTWVDIEKMYLSEITESAQSTNIYTLEWYWEENENDTKIGKQIYATYKCKINVISELDT